ncbi:hypothetical protein BXZ70DRAFT_1062198 [Cristinia sonorae]|uniref:NAD(P)-binding domain-containing protein n=1 Tax=Cristinia sonorae TaxID=1940300 RepID=A0A8K0UVU4_9AGAR|nr:hypothetical protein BXZ70DRAFT_1062198 [Cristinia sonorae]
MSGKSALIIGATGQVGSHLLQQLLKDNTFSRVGEYGRRVTAADKIEAGKEKLVQKEVDFEKIEEAGLKDGKWDVVYITLGTTRAVAGSAAAFEKIDREYVINAARAAKSDDPNHLQRVVYLSSTGANPSAMFLYPKSKGLTELGLASLGYSETIIFRPGLLSGTQRAQSRFAESMAEHVINLRGSWQKNYSCPISTVARGMLVAGVIGSENFPAAVKATKEGGSTPFTVVDNVGTRVIGESV